MKRDYDWVICDHCETTKHGGTVTYDEQMNVVETVCDDCNSKG